MKGRESTAFMEESVDERKKDRRYWSAMNNRWQVLSGWLYCNLWINEIERKTWHACLQSIRWLTKLR